MIVLAKGKLDTADAIMLFTYETSCRSQFSKIEEFKSFKEKARQENVEVQEQRILFVDIFVDIKSSALPNFVAAMLISLSYIIVHLEYSGMHDPCKAKMPTQVTRRSSEHHQPSLSVPPSLLNISNY